MGIEKPFAPSCERNQDAILEVLKELIADYDEKLFEIAAGTGQHAVYMAPHFSHMDWVVSDKKETHTGMKMWLEEFRHSNVKGPIEYEVGKDSFSHLDSNYIFTSNSFHYMPWKTVKSLIKELGSKLRDGTQFIIYGPFNYGGEYISEGNKSLDEWLKTVDPSYAIRNFEDVKSCMLKNSFQLFQDYSMPANNRLLVFTKL